MRVTILGCGGAGGVPLIGGRWGACDPNNHKNLRRRASILVEHGDARILVDTSPDMRQQLLDAKVSRIDAILYTHEHADHTHGIDEVRELNRLQSHVIDAFGAPEVIEFLIKKFGYIFDPPKKVDGRPVFFKPCLNAISVRWGEAFDAAGIRVLPFEQDHGFIRTTGYRFGDLAYSTDLVRLPESAFSALAGIKVWIVGCLQEAEHPTHAHLGRVLGWIERVKPERAILTHLSHRLDYDALSAKLPPNIVPGYDRMVIDI